MCTPTSKTDSVDIKNKAESYKKISKKTRTEQYKAARKVIEEISNSANTVFSVDKQSLKIHNQKIHAHQ